MSSQVRRKLTTILAADAEGYSRAMDQDEVGAFGALRAARETFTKFIERHEGRIVNTAGDGLIAEFASVVEAVQCAMEVQQELRNVSHSASNALNFRIGIHLGDVMIDGTDLLGEGVNLAARLQSMAEPGGILISRQVYDQVQHKLEIGFEYLGEKRPKNFAEDVEVYRLSQASKAGWTSRSKQQSQAERPPKQAAPKLDKEPSSAISSDSTNSLIRQAALAGIITLGLLILNLVGGGPLWMHWPALGMAALLALKAAPLFTRGWFNTQIARGLVIIATLTLINLFTWDGYPWAIWPAVGLIALGLLRQVGQRFP